MAKKQTGRRQSALERGKTVGMTREQMKRYHAAKRRKALRRQRRIFMGASAVVLVIAFLFLLRSMGFFEKRADVTTLTLNADGSITFEEVEKIEDASADEVKSFIRDAIKTYNRQQKGNGVKLKRFSEKNGTIYARTTYADAAVYADFTGLTLFAGTISEAQGAGYDLSDVYVTIADGKKGKTAEITGVLSDKKRQVLIVEQNIRVVLPADILFITDNATTVDGKTVIIDTGDDKALATTVMVYDGSLDSK